MHEPKSSEPGTGLGALGTAAAVMEHLVRLGVEQVLLCPGSRSAPMAYALASAETAGALEVQVRLDERDAGFVALGLAAATAEPVAIVTTSGTAVGELLPAVMEADHAQVPLLVLSCDRPAELHGTGANQTTDQAGLFGSHVRASSTVEAGAEPGPAVDRAVGAARGDEETAPGPVQLNLCFRDPLVPAEDAAAPVELARAVRPDWLDDIGCLEADTADAAAPGRPLRRLVTGPVSSGRTERRSIVIAGHGAGEQAADFAAALGLPLLAEPSSNARFGPTAVSTYQYLLPAFADEIDTVVLFGRPTLSRPVSAVLNREDVAAWIHQPGPVAWYRPGRRRERPVADLRELAAAAGEPEPGWTARWLAADAAVRQRLELVLSQYEAATGRLTGPGLATTVWNALTGPLVLGSSRPIRDLDLMGTPRSNRGPRVYANRGLAGIDGTIATAQGVALGERRRTLALMGDVTFLHDVGGLLTPSEERVPRLDVIVAQDDGGSIFSTLEHGAVGQRDGYATAVRRYFRTPHGLEAVGIAEAYGWEASTAVTHQGVAAWIADGTASSARRLLEVPVQSKDPRGLHQALTAAAREVLEIR